MRIKYKVWDKKLNQWVDDDMVCLTPDGEILVFEKGNWAVGDPERFGIHLTESEYPLWASSLLMVSLSIH